MSTTAHQVRVAHTASGYRAECATCDWRSLWQATSAVAEFFAGRHQDQPDRT